MGGMLLLCRLMRRKVSAVKEVMWVGWVQGRSGDIEEGGGVQGRSGDLGEQWGGVGSRSQWGYGGAMGWGGFKVEVGIWGSSEVGWGGFRDEVGIWKSSGVGGVVSGAKF